MRCADAIVDALVRAGIDTVYGVPGGAISPLYDALIGRDEIRVVHVRHETSALFMAVGHVRMRPDSVPCVLTTSGPGVTNAVTGVAAAFGEGTPVLIIGGEVPTSKFGRGALQEGSSATLDVVGMLSRVTRSASCLLRPEQAPIRVAAAVAEARAGRGGPVFLSLPLDVAVASVHAPPVAFGITPPAPPEPADALIERAVQHIAEASRPLVLVGSGARSAAASVWRLAKRIGAPVITSPKAKGVVPETWEQCLGVFGYGGHPSAAHHLSEEPPDVVLAVGCGLNEVSTNSWSSLLHGTHAFIQIDIDATQFGRNYTADVPLHGDASAVLERLLASMGHVPRREPSSAGLQRLPTRESSEEGLSTARVVRALQAGAPRHAVFTADIGEHLLFAIHHLIVERPDQFIANLALGSMGSGIGAAIGAKLAAPDRPVIAVCGDYGWQMFGMDLHTCVQEGVAVVFAIMNDRRMRMVEAGIDRIYGRGLPMHGPPVDFAACARAVGAEGHRIETLDQLERLMRRPMGRLPRVLDVRIDPTCEFPANARVAEISNFASQ